MAWYLDWHAPGDDGVRRTRLSRFAGSSGVVAGPWARISLQAWCDGEARGGGFGDAATGRSAGRSRRECAGRAFLLVRPVFSAGNTESGGWDGGVMSQEQGGEVAAPLRRGPWLRRGFPRGSRTRLVLEEALRVIIVEGVGFGVPAGLGQASTFVCGWAYFVFFEMRCGGDHRENGRGDPGSRGRGRTMAVRALRREGPPVALWARAAVWRRGIR